MNAIQNINLKNNHGHTIELQGEEGIQKKGSLLVTRKIKLLGEGININYAELGAAVNPTVLLLHGVPENLQAWYAVAPLLEKNYHVLVMDLPGFGKSDALPNSEDYTSRYFSKVIVDFLASLNITQVNLVATDISLLPALLVGLEHPGLVSKMVVMDGIPFPRPQYSSWELKSFARKGSIIGKALVAWFPGVSSQIARLKGFYRGNSIPAEIRQSFAMDGIQKSTQQAFLSYFQNFRKEQEYFEPRVQELKTSVLVVWGKNDRFINFRLGTEITTTLPNAKLKLIEKCGHYVHMDKPNELVQLIEEHLEEK